MKTRDKIIIGAISTSVAIAIAITVGVVVSKKKKATPQPPPESPLSCPQGIPTNTTNTQCLCPPNLAGTECAQETCDPLPGTWQMFRVGVGEWGDFPGLWTSTLEPHAHINWNTPVTEVRDLPLVQHTGDEGSLYSAYTENEEWRNLPRLWYTSVEQYLNTEGSPMYPHIAVGFRRLDENNVEVVLLPATYSNIRYNPDDPNPITPIPGGRRQGIAVLQVHSPAGQCFVMPPLDFEAEFHTSTLVDILNMRLSPLDLGEAETVNTCVFGTFDNSGNCGCENNASGKYCQFSARYNCPNAPLDENDRPICT
jgi:hypothetical protein